MPLSNVARVFISRLSGRKLTDDTGKLGPYARLWPRGHGGRRLEWFGKVKDRSSTLAAIKDPENLDGTPGNVHKGAGPPASWTDDDEKDYLLIRNMVDRLEGWDVAYSVFADYVLTVYKEGVEDGWTCRKENPNWSVEECIEELTKDDNGTGGDEHDSY